jgi:hypothetical protein
MIPQFRPLSLVLFAVAILFPAARATNYYVSVSGNDSNSGTSTTSPWRHVQYAANHVQAGDTVNLLAGSYNETVNIPASGSATAGYITFQNYAGQAAAVDGTGLSIPGGQYGLFNIASQSYVIIQGLEIRNYKTTKRNIVPVGIYISGAGGFIKLLNNHIHDIVTSASGCNANALGIAVYGTMAPASLNNITISGNEINSLKTGCSETMSLDGNVDTFTVSNNLIHDNNNIGIDAIGFEGVSPDPAYDQARNGEITLNTVYNISSQGNPSYPKGCWCSDGIYVDGGTKITIERNLVHNVDLGIEMASEHSGRDTSYVTARNNLIYFGNSAGISIGGYANNVGGSDNIDIVNNSLLENDGKNTGSGEFQIQFHATSNLFENNIVYAGKQGLLVNDFTNSTSSPATLDYNLYYFVGSANSATFVWQKNSYNGITAYQTASGEDDHSFYTDPLYLSLTTPNLQVQPSSRAVNAGNNLGSAIVGTLDFAGNPRVQGSNIDIGAYEQP